MYNYKKDKIKNTEIGNHYLKLKKLFYNLLYVCKNLLKLNMYTIKEVHNNVLEQVNDLLNAIMEWFICAKIQQSLEKKKNRPIIIHAGLFHSDSVINWLVKNYNYK